MEKKFKHLAENQFDWLQKYLMKPVEKIRKLYLNNTEVINYLESNDFKLTKYESINKIFTYERNNIKVTICGEYMVINNGIIAMDVILTKGY